MSEPRVDPFDQTKIIPGVPELPAEATLVLPPDQPKPTQPVPVQAKRPWKAIAGSAAAVILLTAGMTWWFLRPPAPIQEPLPDKVPLPLQGYVDAAKLGDAKAMRMLGASYTYGLGVPVNKAQGLAWYRKAADAGDPAAVAEVKALEGRK
ncbi:MAG: sel1 repeat family protein [Acidobacteria bacterium]|nr:sel1 repeat family protein [Acidobacteriota bacterium]